MSTIDYYNENSNDYFNTTVNIDMTKEYNMFEKYLCDKAKILDFGCGSGRDIKYFLSKGYDVKGIDGSIKLCELARNYTGQEITNMDFKDFNEINIYDGIWSCASLVHLKQSELKEVLIKLRDALKNDGIIYASMKNGMGYKIDKYGRYINYINEFGFMRLSNDIGLETIDYNNSSSKKDASAEKWHNFILRRK